MFLTLVKLLPLSTQLHGIVGTALERNIILSSSFASTETQTQTSTQTDTYTYTLSQTETIKSTETFSLFQTMTMTSSQTPLSVTLSIVNTNNPNTPLPPVTIHENETYYNTIHSNYSVENLRTITESTGITESIITGITSTQTQTLTATITTNISPVPTIITNEHTSISLITDYLTSTATATATTTANQPLSSISFTLSDTIQLASMPERMTTVTATTYLTANQMTFSSAFLSVSLATLTISQDKTLTQTQSHPPVTQTIDNYNKETILGLLSTKSLTKTEISTLFSTLTMNPETAFVTASVTLISPTPTFNTINSYVSITASSSVLFTSTTLLKETSEVTTTRTNSDYPSATITATHTSTLEFTTSQTRTMTAIATASNNSFFSENSSLTTRSQPQSQPAQTQPMMMPFKFYGGNQSQPIMWQQWPQGMIQ